MKLDSHDNRSFSKKRPIEPASDRENTGNLHLAGTDHGCSYVVREAIQDSTGFLIKFAHFLTPIFKLLLTHRAAGASWALSAHLWAISRISRGGISLGVLPACRFDSILEPSNCPFQQSRLGPIPVILFYPSATIPPVGGMSLAWHSFAVLLWPFWEVASVSSKIIVIPHDHPSVTYTPSVCDIDCTRDHFQEWSVFRRYRVHCRG